MNKEAQDLLLQQLNDELNYFKLRVIFSPLTNSIKDELTSILEKYKNLGVITYKIEKTSNGYDTFIKPITTISQITLNFVIN